MRGIIGIAAGMVMLAHAAAAQGTTITGQVYDRITVFSLPPGFVVAYEHEEEGSYNLDLMVEGETVEDWSEMITLSGAEGLATQMPDPMDTALLIGQGYEDSCPTTYVGSDEGPLDIPGADAAHLVMFSCGDSGGYSESAMFVVAVSGADVFTLHWAERAGMVQGQMQHDPAVWVPRMDWLLTLRLCPVIAGEEPPYPSCLP